MYGGDELVPRYGWAALLPYGCDELVLPGCDELVLPYGGAELGARLGRGSGSPESGRSSSAAEGGVGWCMGGFFCTLCAPDMCGAGWTVPGGQALSGDTTRSGVPPLR